MAERAKHCQANGLSKVLEVLLITNRGFSAFFARD
jgi:hypothetical protein